MSLNSLLFFLFAVGAIATGIVMITRKNAVTSAVFLIAHFFCLSALYLSLQAQLLALLQILVYAGAIMVLVVFVIMLLNLGAEEKAAETLNIRGLLGITVAGVLGVQLLAVFMARPSGHNELPPIATSNGTVEALGRALFTDYIFPFEAISLLLLAAIIGAVLLAKRHLEQVEAPKNISTDDISVQHQLSDKPVH